MKKLDEEYKKACAEETPDLWNRIEAGLPPKTEQTQAAIRKVWVRYGAFVAAAVMVLVTVPGLLHMKQAKNTNENAASMGMTDMTAAGENTTGMADAEEIAGDSRDTEYADAFPGECDDAYSEEAQNGTAQENTAVSELLPGVCSMEL